jgi:hypothetical protein
MRIQVGVGGAVIILPEEGSPYFDRTCHFRFVQTVAVAHDTDSSRSLPTFGLLRRSSASQRYQHCCLRYLATSPLWEQRPSPRLRSQRTTVLAFSSPTRHRCVWLTPLTPTRSC